MGFGPKGLSAVESAQQVAKGGSYTFMSEAEHDVRIVGIDTNKIDAHNYITVKFENSQGREHNQLVYLVEKDRKTGKEQWGWKFNQLIAALLCSPEAVTCFFTEAELGNARVFDAFIDLRCRIKLERDKRKGKYGAAETLEDGTYVVREYHSGDIVGRGATPKDAGAAAEADGFKKSYLQVSTYTPCAGDTNLVAFTNAMRGVNSKTAPAASFPAVAKSTTPSLPTLKVNDIPF